MDFDFLEFRSVPLHVLKLGHLRQVHSRRHLVWFTPHLGGAGDVFLDLVASEESDCHATLGYNPGRNPTLVLNPQRCVYLGTVIHELLHVLGMQHTHQRNDRDDHVEILPENIKVGYLA